jgi:hypothetical protein
LDQLKTDFDSIKSRLVNAGLLAVPRDPLTIGADHYRTQFMGLRINGADELRSDADSAQILLSGKPSDKRAAFNRIFKQEEAFINLLLKSGMKLPAN